jgi:hypothetical protein
MDYDKVVMLLVLVCTTSAMTWVATYIYMNDVLTRHRHAAVRRAKREALPPGYIAVHSSVLRAMYFTLCDTDGVTIRTDIEAKILHALERAEKEIDKEKKQASPQ